MDVKVDSELLLDGKIMVIRHGRSSFRIVEALSDEEAQFHGALDLS